MKIGKIDIYNPVFLAPMAGVTDVVFREICKDMGCGVMFTEMVSGKGIIYNNENTLDILETKQSQRPVGAQLFGCDPEILSLAVERIEPLDIDFIDVNMGCPAPKIFRNGEGSALMENPELIGEIIKKMTRATKKPITIKIRKGIDENSVNAVKVAQIAEDMGAAAITVHGRTREQYYSGKADLDIIKAVKGAVSIPVIGNGDVSDPISAMNMLEFTGCDGVMVGRGAMGNPWIFREINYYMTTGKLMDRPTDAERSAMALSHAKELIKLKGEYIGVREMRKHLSWYTKGMDNSARLREKINKAETLKEIGDCLGL